MTLEEYVAMVEKQRDVIAVHLYNAKHDLSSTSPMTEEVRKQKEFDVTLFDAKLDMMQWVVVQAKKIEMPKTKMREFL